MVRTDELARYDVSTQVIDEDRGPYVRAETTVDRITYGVELPVNARPPTILAIEDARREAITWLHRHVSESRRERK